KETTITLPLVIGAYELFVRHRDSHWFARLQKAIVAVLPFACATLAYFAIRYSVLGVIFGEFTNGNFPDDAALTMADRLRRLALIWIIIPLLPQLNMNSFVSEELLHDRFLYLSMLGVGLLAGLLAHRLASLQRWRLSGSGVAIIVGVALTFLCATTVAQNRQW